MRLFQIYLMCSLILEIPAQFTDQASNCDYHTSRENTIPTELGNIFSNTITPTQQCDSRCFPYRTDLQCGRCQLAVYSQEKEQCCACSAKPDWIGQEQDLFVEYISIFGKSIVLTYGADNSSAIYQVVHNYGEMSEIPSNVCNWDTISRSIKIYVALDIQFDTLWTKIGKLDFSHNKIRQIVDLNCLENLDTLDLSYNKIKNIHKSSIFKLLRLRNIFLQYNQIDHIDVNIFMDMHVLSVDLSHNMLKELDVTNILPYYPFCKMDYSYNKIETMTNKCGFKVDGTHVFGPGFVDFKSNSFRKFPDFKELLHMEDLSQLINFLRCGFDFRYIPIDCDCVLEPYLELAKNFVIHFWLDYMNVTCNTPKHLHNIALVNVNLDDFKCDLNDHPDCPVHCNCTDQPHARTLFIDCHDQGKTEIPHTIPTSRYSPYVSLNMSGNSITTIRNESYLENVTVLDVSKNDLKEFSSNAANNLEKAVEIKISGNPGLVSLPQAMQYHNMCKFDTNDLIMQCDCNTQWLTQWVYHKECLGNQTQNFKCQVPGHGVMPANEFSLDLLDCFVKSMWKIILSLILAGFALLLVLIGLLIHMFRYEILILILRVRQTNKNKITPEFEYDAFLSFDDDVDEIFDWVNRALLPHLEEKGYQVFLHYRDMNIGDVRDLATIKVMKSTKNFVPILSKSYLKRNDESTTAATENEWKYGWQMFKSDPRKNIVLINFDHISSFEEKNPKMKAFIRVGGQVKFSNTKRDIMEQIAAKLGPPCCKPRRRDNLIPNKKLKQTCFGLFEVQPTISKSKRSTDEGSVDADEGETINKEIEETVDEEIKNAEITNDESNECDELNDILKSDDEGEVTFLNIKYIRRGDTFKNRNIAKLDLNSGIDRPHPFGKFQYYA